MVPPTLGQIMELLLLHNTFTMQLFVMPFISSQVLRYIYIILGAGGKIMI